MARSLLVASAAAVLASQVSTGCQVQQNTAYSGYDLAYSIVAPGDYNSCLSACLQNHLCAAFTLYPNGRCFVKSAAGLAENMAGAMSCNGLAMASMCPFGLTPCPSNSTAPGACATFVDTCNKTTSCVAGNTLCPDGTCVSSAVGWSACPPGSVPSFYDPSQPLETRVSALVSALSLEDIAPQLNNQGYGTGPPGPPGIPALSIPPYNWLNEGLHGVARSGLATSFPQIAVAGQSFNRSSWYGIGRVLGLEARVKSQMYRRMNDSTDDYTGVTYYAPNINLGRDPRWGRIQEVPTEDPTVMAAYGTAVVLGAQAGEGPEGDVPPAWLVDPTVRGTPQGRRAARAPKPHRGLRALGAHGAGAANVSAIIACCKHAVAYSVELVNGVDRHHFDSIVTGGDLLDSYLPAFQSCFMEGGGRSSMCSYNAVNGVPTCASHFLLNTTIRQRYGMGEDVFVMSDYGAVGDAYSGHSYCATKDDCTAATLAAGVDQDGGGTDYQAVPTFVQNGLLTDAQVRTAASRLFRARFSLGLLDYPEAAPWQGLDAPSTLDTDAHRQMSLEAAQQGVVLLTNPRGALPLNPATVRKVAVIGPNADVPDTLYGNYQGTPPYLITPRMGMIAALGGSNSSVYYAQGCNGVACPDTSGFAAAVSAASQPDADAVILVLGIDQSVEAEGKDRTNVTLPGMQTGLAQAVCGAAAARKVPCIVVYITGGPLADPWSQANAGAVLVLGYASQSAGTALASVLLGQYSPAGKLAVTWPASVADLPPMADMGMRPNATAGTRGRTYRFSAAKPLYPFGHGLTYTTWTYSNLQVPSSPPQPCAGVPISVTLTNSGPLDSTEVVQVYVSWGSNIPGAYAPAQLSLSEFERVLVPKGGSTTVSFTLSPSSLSLVNATAAATFGQDFRMADGTSQAHALSGRAFGLDTDYHGLAMQAGAGPIGWDDMMMIPTGVPVSIWIGSGQPGTGAPGLSTTVTLAGPAGGAVNLAVCDLSA